MRDPEKCLPVIKERLSDLYDIASAVQQRQLDFRDDDHFGWMIFLFFAKQTEHTRGILTLAEKGLYRDAGLIARSMMEGIVQLDWASKDPQARALAWKEFMWVSSWRKMMNDEEASLPLPADERARIEAEVRNRGEQFLTREGRQRHKNGQPLRKNHYFENWTGQKLRPLFEDVGLRKVYLLAYSELSIWHHWNQEIMAEAIHIDHERGRISYLEPSPRAGALALANALQALFQTLEHVDAHFKLNVGKKLNEVKKELKKGLALFDGTETNGPDSTAPGKR